MQHLPDSVLLRFWFRFQCTVCSETLHNTVAAHKGAHEGLSLRRGCRSFRCATKGECTEQPAARLVNVFMCNDAPGSSPMANRLATDLRNEGKEDVALPQRRAELGMEHDPRPEGERLSKLGPPGTDGHTGLAHSQSIQTYEAAHRRSVRAGFAPFDTRDGGTLARRLSLATALPVGRRCASQPTSTRNRSGANGVEAAAPVTGRPPKARVCALSCPPLRELCEG